MYVYVCVYICTYMCTCMYIYAHGNTLQHTLLCLSLVSLLLTTVSRAVRHYTQWCRWRERDQGGGGWRTPSLHPPLPLVLFVCRLLFLLPHTPSLTPWTSDNFQKKKIVRSHSQTHSVSHYVCLSVQMTSKFYSSNWMQHTGMFCNTRQHTATHCNTLCLSLCTDDNQVPILLLTARQCSTLHRPVAHCSTLQHTATHCNTLRLALCAHDNKIPLLLLTAPHYNTLCLALCAHDNQIPLLLLTAPHYNTLCLALSAQMTTKYHSSYLTDGCWSPTRPVSLQHTATHCNTLQHTAIHCNTLQHTATQYRTDGCWCSTRPVQLQHTATHCNTLQHTATHCYALQHTAQCSFKGV